jgi:diguanylate cyclase (GGDEF)-like protein
MIAVLLTQLVENAGFRPLLRGAEPTRARILLAMLGSALTTTTFGLAAPLLWARGGIEAGAGSIMFLFGGSMMALMAAQGSLPAFIGTVLPYLLVGTGMAMSSITLGQETALSWPLVVGFFVLIAVMCLLWKWSARARRAEIEAREEIERGRERAEAAERQVRHLAYSDTLTGLPNRHSFDVAVAEAIATKESVALLLLDLNGFKRVNDRHGHPVGDELLRQVGIRLTSHIASSITAARLGGDEFAIILTGGGERQALDLACRVLSLLEQPYITRAGLQRIGSAVGIAICPAHATDPSELLRRADLALYKSKATGGTEAVLFESGMEQRGSDRRTSEPQGLLRA